MSTPDAYFDALDGPMADLARGLRDRVRERAPHLSEALAWGFPCFSGDDRVFSIIAHTGHVNLQLWNGNRLAAAHPRVAGTGKQLRHVKLKGGGELDDELDAIIDAAAALDREGPERVR